VGAQEGPLKDLPCDVVYPSIEVLEYALQFSSIDGFGKVEVDFEIVEPIVKMAHVEIVVFGNILRQWPAEIPVNC
jgi:hypothetical protein